MIILRQKAYSSLGKIWAGTKRAVPAGLKGAIYGGLFAPGNGLAYLTGHKKLAAGITAAGAIIGGGLGAYLGYNSGVNDYNFKEHMKTPEGRKEIYEENIKNLKREATECYKCDLDIISSYNVNKTIDDFREFEASENIKFPEELYKYIKIYHQFAKLNLKDFYSSFIKSPEKYFNIDNPNEFVFVYCFTDLFPCPTSEFLDPIDYEFQFTISQDPDIALGWNYEDKKYDTTCFGGTGDSLKAILSSNINRVKQYLTADQIKISNKLISKI